MSIPPDKSPDRITPGKSLEPVGTTPSKPPTDFQSYMRDTSPQSKTPTPPPGPAAAPTPAELASSPSLQPTGVTLDTLAAQAKTVQDSLGNVANQLNTPNLRFKRSQSHLLRNKLQDANGHMEDAAQKLGLEKMSMQMPPGGATAIDRFLAYVNHGQEQMMAVQSKLKEISSLGKEIRPADMLLVQVKMNQAQQEIEYSSTLLSKVVDSLKTIINIQL